MIGEQAHHPRTSTAPADDLEMTREEFEKAASLLVTSLRIHRDRRRRGVPSAPVAPLDASGAQSIMSESGVLPAVAVLLSSAM